LGGLDFGLAIERRLEYFPVGVGLGFFAEKEKLFYFRNLLLQNNGLFLNFSYVKKL
jgi:hypothetical protein